jgi:hypothetical protein
MGVSANRSFILAPSKMTTGEMLIPDMHICKTAKLMRHPSDHSFVYKHIFSLLGRQFCQFLWHNWGQFHRSTKYELVCLLNPILSTDSTPCNGIHCAEFCSFSTLYTLIYFVVSSVTSFIVPSTYPTNTNHPFDSPGWTDDLSLQLQQL